MMNRFKCMLIDPTGRRAGENHSLDPPPATDAHQLPVRLQNEPPPES